MRPNNSTQRWFAAAVCVLVTSSFAAAEEGVVRISDADTRPGIVRMGTGQRSGIQQTAYGTAGHSGVATAKRYAAAAQRYQSSMGQFAQQTNRNPYQVAAFSQQSPPAAYQPMALTSCQSGQCGCGTDGCGSGGCGSGCGNGFEGCHSGRCKSGRGQCDGYFPSGRDAGRMRRNGKHCDNDVCFGDDFDQRMWSLFTRATPKDGVTAWPVRWWRGQQLNYTSRNQRLSNTLFGWLVPSGCNGQGCPPLGCYNVTYADDPGYTDGRDSGPAYGAQGYGVHMSVPLAPNVRHSYNYSWGTPSSRITQMGSYSPGAAQQSPHQSW